jgi:hypothetical protein
VCMSNSSHDYPNGVIYGLSKQVEVLTTHHGVSTVLLIVGATVGATACLCGGILVVLVLGVHSRTRAYRNAVRFDTTPSVLSNELESSTQDEQYEDDIL